MSWKATGKFACDGCKVVTSDEIELLADELQPMLPNEHWLRVEQRVEGGEIAVVNVTHYCPSCAPLIRSYLKGRVP